MKKIIKNISNFLGEKINSKVIVIESDDWGSIRMSSENAFKNLKNKGYPVDQCSYNTNDALESNKDLEMLFEVINNIKGSDDKPAIFTVNNIVANPDFVKIKESGFSEYFFEPFTETLKKYPCHDKVMNLYREGINQSLIMPQFHGREHVHIIHWLNDLKNQEAKAEDAFDQKMFSVFLGSASSCNKEYLNAMAYYSNEQEVVIKDSVKSGLNLFKAIWGFNSDSVIAPCYQWHPSLEDTFYNNGIKLIQGGVAQISPNINGEGNTSIRHFNGQKNKLRQVYTVRNVIFEPSTNLHKDWIDSAMSEISNAFFWNQPAIISSHRLNYIGWLNEMNRTRNLDLLSKLLKRIVNKWPEVKFISSNQMLKYYS